LRNLQNIITSEGNEIETYSHSFPLILVFLRHFECVFCKEAIRELSQMRPELEEKKVKVIFIHMSDAEVANKYFSEFNFPEAEHVSDPDCRIYSDFGLAKGSFSQLFGLKVWSRGYQLRQTGLKMTRKTMGDSLQMPGVFVVHQGKVIDSYIHKSIADKPDYEKFMNCCND